MLIHSCLVHLLINLQITGFHVTVDCGYSDVQLINCTFSDVLVTDAKDVSTQCKLHPQSVSRMRNLQVRITPLLVIDS